MTGVVYTCVAYEEGKEAGRGNFTVKAK